jgi:hypothetical protein
MTASFVSKIAPSNCRKAALRQKLLEIVKLRGNYLDLVTIIFSLPVFFVSNFGINFYNYVGHF